MQEREKSETYAEGVRELSVSILQNSKDILSVDFDLVEGSLLTKLQELKSERKSNVFFEELRLSPEDELGLNLFLSSINFCYQDPKTHSEYTFLNKEGEVDRRSLGLKSAMAESGVPWGDFSSVSEITAEKWKEMLQLSKKNPIYLGTERGRRVVRLAEQMLALGLNTPTDLVKYCEFDSEKLLMVLDKSGFFEDEFMKRSQLAVHVMDGVLKRRFDAKLEGTDRLTVMADYRLPQLMYNFGAIKLSTGLHEKLMRSESIETGSREEKTLRAAAIVIGRRVSELMGIPEAETDSLLWTLAVRMGFKNQLPIPHMIVATDKY